MALGETKGIILFTKDYKEKDKLVKIFTESFGKLMFFVKGAHRKNNPISSAILPFTEAVYIGDFREDGLSFLNGSKEVYPLRIIQEDIFINAYATYILNLVDAAIEDRTYDPNLYQFVQQALKLLNENKDAEIVTNIFEIQLLSRFGISPEWRHCSVCQQTQGKFDYSSKYSGVLCERHWSLDDHRYHADPRAIHFIRLFSSVSYDKVQDINVKSETKAAIRKTIDELYDEYVGIQLKSKKFIDQMKSWEDTLKLPIREKKSEIEDNNLT
ncbi:DNA repair protein RecO [Enterococcus ureilyticus]|uniref:DNA repair protein RecO n=1 Tax=Enterococcus ureilyticus TaxID=1131292 RepID=A0A1E5HA04_9ENTE|nr:DNA repair protein RecO [Enterococcus ureilyticus]MBM7688278.1 DNA repair protein RecO (recombination protein O) [Enterococcus ureilyticus]OEG21782.1 DNA repair protein RecO [Enterococcus ureilyticus]